LPIEQAVGLVQVVARTGKIAQRHLDRTALEQQASYVVTRLLRFPEWSTSAGRGDQHRNHDNFGKHAA